VEASESELLAACGDLEPPELEGAYYDAAPAQVQIYLKGIWAAWVCTCEGICPQ